MNYLCSLLLPQPLLALLNANTYLLMVLDCESMSRWTQWSADTEINPELRQRLKEPVKRFIKFLKSELDEKTPTQTVYFVEDGDIRGEEVPDFGDIANDFVNDPESIFSDVVDWFINSDNGYRESAGPPGDWELVEGDEPTTLEGEYTRDFIWFAGNVMQYTGSYEYSDHEYDLAFDSNFAHRYDIPVPEKTLVPLKNFEAEKKIELATSPDVLGFESAKSIESIEIEHIGKNEYSSILTSSHGSLYDTNSGAFGHEWTHVIRIVTYGGPYKLAEISASMTTNGIRLFSPEKLPVGMGDGFEIKPNGLAYRVGHEICRGQSVIAEDIGQYFDRTHSLNQGDISDFHDFWSRYADHLFTGLRFHSKKPPKSEEIARPLRRFNQTYFKERNDDAVIDCIIGFESTITKDGGRLSDRGVLVLDDTKYSNRYVYDFLSELWSLRNQIVHQDKGMHGFEIEGEEINEYDVIPIARSFLANTVLWYIDRIKEYSDKNITEINQDVLRPLLISRITGA